MAILNVLEKDIASVSVIHADGTPTVSIALLADGKISSHVITDGTENTDTLYQACSISKAITALAVAKFVDQGRLSYDDKIVAHLPQDIIDIIVEPKTAHLMQHVTVGMLLSHTSGLSQHGFPGYPQESVPSARDILSGNEKSNTAKVRFNSFPGAQFEYSGGGFVVLQVLLETIFDIDFPELMQHTVLRPLNMTRSHFGGLSPEEKNYTRPFWTAYSPAPPGPLHFRELAAAGIWTTPTDLLKANSAVQTSLHTDSGFLSRATARKMLTTVLSGSYGAWGLGWSISEDGFAHGGGNYPGYECYTFGSFSQKVTEAGHAAEDDAKSQSMGPGDGFCIMTNAEGGTKVIKKIISALFFLNGWGHIDEFPSLLGKTDWVPYMTPIDAVAEGNWKSWIGEWEGGWEIRDNAGPELLFRGIGAMKLRPGASPVATVNGKQDVILVADGLDIAVRLTWVENEKVVELLQWKQVKTLKAAREV